MSRADWGNLLKIQDEFSREQDLQKRQREKYYQQLYKDGLEQALQEQNTKRLSEKQQEKRIMSYSSEKQQTIIQKELQEREKWNRLRNNFALSNYHSSLERKLQVKEQQQQDRATFNEKFRRINTEVEEEREREKRSYSQKQYELAKAYDSQLEEENRRKRLERFNDHQFEETAQMIEERRERERVENLNKIKYGYGQNKVIFDLSKQAKEERERQRVEFIGKMSNEKANSPPYQEQVDDLKDWQAKSRLVKQTSSYNKDLFSSKAYRKKLALAEETMQDNQKLLEIQRSLEEDRRITAQQKERQKANLQIELERQIKEFQSGKLKSRRMNPEEEKINRSLYQSQKIKNLPLLPGVSYDHQIERQNRLIQRFLKSGATSSLQENDRISHNSLV